MRYAAGERSPEGLGVYALLRVPLGCSFAWPS